MTSPIVTVDRLSIDTRSAQRDIRLIDGVSFDLYRGEMVGLVGESGSGKSLTGSALAALLPTGVERSGGRVLVNGREVDDSAKTCPDDVAMIFQNPMTSLNPSLRVGDQIAEAIRLRHRGMSRRESRRRAVDVLDRVEMNRPAERARQYPFEFSGGMRQRAMIGIAIAREPQVLVADEPTTALDVTVQKNILDLIDTLRTEMGLAVLLISHDLAVVSERSDRMMVMYAGQLVETGSTEPMLGAPMHPYLEGLLRCVPERAAESGELRPLPGQVLSLADAGPGCRFAARCELCTPECMAAPVPLDTMSGGRQVRCIRPNEPVGAGGPPLVSNSAQPEVGGV
ncbi:ABC transporter ATP-binding protein [Gordonia sp. CPCC 206044]|uniref:ABC transporter ATP-binding protein n=1 Tax=Gordonia sp. CPCC 206044 TaxID=3140793 RepID=UPI003AF3C20A